MAIAPPQQTNVKIIFALTLVHFMGDFYSSFIIPLMPAFIDKLSLSLAQVGIITGTVRFLAFIVQPSVGYVADRYPTRFFALGGLLFTVLFIPMSGLAPTFVTLTVVLALGSIGSSMFHPSITGMVPVYGGRNTGFSMSIFNTGGTLAFGIGPIFITWFVAQYGLSAMPATMLIGLVTLGFLYRVLPTPEREVLEHNGFIGALKDTLGEVWKAVLLIWLVMVLRSIVGQSFLTFMPIFLAGKGHSLVSIGTVTALFIVAGTLSGLAAGYFADKYSFKSIFYCTHGLMSPALLLFLNLSGNWAYVGAFIAGLFVLATLPIGVVMAQALAPRGRSMVASLMMGFAYGLGGVVSPAVGKLCDIFSIQSVLYYVAFIPLLTLGLIFFFPNVGGKKRPI